MDKKYIDINCDLGEGGKHDAELLKLVSSCNIACGGHCGTKETVANTVNLAIENNVKLGAHPSYPDRENFGRKYMGISAQVLMESLYKQILLVRSEAEAKEAALHHVKPHGALYHELIAEERLAEMFVQLVYEMDKNIILYAPPHSCIHQLAKGKLKVYTEGFADRKYKEDYNLLQRNQAGAVIHNKEKVAEQVIAMIKHNKIPVDSNTNIDCKVDTICVHGDNKNALEILQYLEQELSRNAIDIK